MNILALDLATKTGFAVGRPDYPMIHGVQDFTPRRGDSPGMRYVRFSAWLREMLRKCHVNLVVYEQAHQRGGAATEVAAGFATHLQSVIADLNRQPDVNGEIEHTTCHTATLKAFATGNGKATKADMVKRACEVTGETITSDDEADAVMMLLWAQATYAEDEG